MQNWRSECLRYVTIGFDRAAGPGGQNVNKLNTRVTLWLDFENCPAFTAEQKATLRERLEKRLARDGRLRIVAQSERSQSANRVAAEERLLEILEQALARPRKRFATRPTAGSRRRRLEDKRHRADTKRGRSPSAGGSAED